ncbi:hypothetical protein M3181_16900 [Mesobacillus maritimus]|uniref:hypothetical protein n=1 Tax=Mesobacillus maritimus TaxID=1643336 RepID=UPI00203D21D0|nr:hypothetical protein [Mesobacillus maritimus]MCM3670644.1 hypothetical protein [Mesobacillus maritimus]
MLKKFVVVLFAMMVMAACGTTNSEENITPEDAPVDGQVEQEQEQPASGEMGPEVPSSSESDLEDSSVEEDSMEAPTSDEVETDGSIDTELNTEGSTETEFDEATTEEEAQ